MGSPISGLIAKAVMQRLEANVIPLVSPKCWFRYVDDTFVIVKNVGVHKTLDLLNRSITGIRFTVEVEQDG